MTRAPRRRDGDQRGAATVLVVSMAAVLLLVGCAVAGVVGILHARRAAQAAADLAALAGAAALQDGGDGCATATALASANHATLEACHVDGEDVVVTAVVPGPAWVGPDLRLTGSARAGPAGRSSSSSPVEW